MLIRSLLAKITLCIIVMEALGGLGAFGQKGSQPAQDFHDDNAESNLG